MITEKKTGKNPLSFVLVHFFFISNIHFPVLFGLGVIWGHSDFVFIRWLNFLNKRLLRHVPLDTVTAEVCVSGLLRVCVSEPNTQWICAGVVMTHLLNFFIMRVKCTIEKSDCCRVNFMGNSQRRLLFILEKLLHGAHQKLLNGCTQAQVWDWSFK